jgi:hypothetical protein
LANSIDSAPTLDPGGPTTGAESHLMVLINRASTLSGALSTRLSPPFTDACFGTSAHSHRRRHRYGAVS